MGKRTKLETGNSKLSGAAYAASALFARDTSPAWRKGLRTLSKDQLINILADMQRKLEAAAVIKPACNEYGPEWRAELLRLSKEDLVSMLSVRRRDRLAGFPEITDGRPVRIKHTASGQYAALEERVRVHAYDDTPPALAITWGTQDDASTLLASTARAVAAAWICVMDDSSIEIEEVDL